MAWSLERNRAADRGELREAAGTVSQKKKPRRGVDRDFFNRQFLRAYLIAFDTFVNVVFKLAPVVFTTAIIATAMPAAIRPYSIAVAPDSSRMNCIDANDATHEEDEYSQEDAKILHTFAEMFLTYAFTLPEMLKRAKGA